MKSLIAIQSELKCNKSQYNSFGKYKYRSCEDILESVKPLLKKNDCLLTLSDDVVDIGGRIYVKATATITDKEGMSQSVTAYARESLEKKGMDDSQITGTASSYARKYALNGLLLIDDTKDADTDENKTETDARAKNTKSTVEKQLISVAKINALVNKCNEDGVDAKKICEWAKVANFNGLTEKQYYYITQNWTKEFKGGE